MKKITESRSGYQVWFASKAEKRFTNIRSSFTRSYPEVAFFPLPLLLPSRKQRRVLFCAVKKPPGDTIVFGFSRSLLVFQIIPKTLRDKKRKLTTLWILGSSGETKCRIFLELFIILTERLDFGVTMIIGEIWRHLTM